MQLHLAIILTITCAVNLAAQNGQPVVKYGGSKKAPRIIEMSNMLGEADGMRCLKRSRPFIGTIVKRDFDEDETMVTGITLRNAKDDRVPINIDGRQIWLLGRTAPTELSSILGKGKRVKIWAYECSGGGSGVFYYADRVRVF